ncbi:TPA: hypothetical protein DCY43_03480 [candidate division WWE3 bacterium]|uniref:Uncharacterized protein n=3 Tax=Katanobacteria TaxID=422282 RepID=A0A0G1KLS7_UNCKA|nr:MAG: hypothetical protein UW65_C0005G0010 [candidate division WWE3 bacterium GW2011_GWB1_44_4]KKT84460.1 MAG: hypothetical protein UW82_C0021G0002 [candidate division WWE3 bacterium GW2011_GWC2_44_9]HAZ29774.1 hypothetical protein [candidate division WWE3 bacterium]
MRSKAFAVINIVVGIFILIAQLVSLILVYPKLIQLYKDMGVQISSSTQYYPLLATVFIAFLVYVMYAAVKLLKSKEPSNSLYKQNFVATIVLLVSGGLFLVLSLMSLINPIYSLAKSF